MKLVVNASVQFNTLHHAVALEEGAVLVTADERYLAKAGERGSVVGLANWAFG